jgi:hypothetical protein
LGVALSVVLVSHVVELRPPRDGSDARKEHASCARSGWWGSDQASHLPEI